MHIDNDGSGAHYGSFGLVATGQDHDDILLTSPTPERFVCNLGIPRVQTRALVMEVTGCHVEIASDSGSGYKLWLERAAGVDPVSIKTRYFYNETTGCRTRDVIVSISNPSCSAASIPGVDHACEDDCRAVLLKGDTARRLPIVVDAGDAVGSEPASVHVVDPQLVLEHTRRQPPWREDDGPVPDLEIVGRRIGARLANARIATVKAETTEGLVRLKKLRFDTAMIWSVEDDVYLEDDRDMALMYRSAKDFVCLSAPLVEDIPDEMNFCEMRSEEDAAKDVHNSYDSIADGSVSRGEFMEGLAEMGLSFEADSLDLNEAQQQQLMDHVFKFTDKSFAMEQLTYERFESQLTILAPYFTTLYDSEERGACLEANPGSNACSFACTPSMTNTRYGGCDPGSGCAPGCGASDVILQSSSDTDGAVDYHYYDTDPPDGHINYEEFRQALLKICGNCTYIIEPRQQDCLTCEYVGGGQYDIDQGSVSRRVCTSYRDGTHARNAADWRVNNVGLRGLDAGFRECRPFPDYDPRLSGIAYDPACTEPHCFLADGSRAPESYYNRSTWTAANYERVMFLLQQVFPRDSKFAGQPYFNISSDDEFREFAAFFFSRTKVYEEVDYETFNNNMQSLKILDGIAENYYLFNPECFKGKFLKVRPAWHLGDTSAAEHVIRRGANGAVEDARFPGFPVNGGADSGTSPCPPEWGNADLGLRPTTVMIRAAGAPMAIPFSYFSWADIRSGLGFKWGKSLPEWCLDERWPDGGVGGLYPANETLKYGAKAGKPIPPGCVPVQCSAYVEAEVLKGSVHAQTLPFQFDAHYNETGLYREMMDNCNSTVDGSSHCFFKGYGDSFSLRLDARSIQRLDEWREEYGDDEDADFVGIIRPRGHGVPDFAKWVWATRDIYLEFEPSWVRIFSGTVLGPKVGDVGVRVTPGFCDAKYGAVEDIDWRDPCFLPSTLALSPTTLYPPGQTDELHCTTLVSDEMRTLRERREAAFFSRLRREFITDESIDIRGSIAKRTVSRALFRDEHLYRSGVTASGHSDVLNAQWRHRKVCVDANCFTYLLHVDNCLVERTAVLVNATTAEYALSPCTLDASFGGASACATGELLPNGDCSGIAKNEKAYLEQFGSVRILRDGDGVSPVRPSQTYSRWDFSQKDRYSQVNITEYAEHFHKLTLAGAQYGRENLHDSWTKNTVLGICIALSMLIAAIAGMGAMYLITSIGIKKLEEVAESLRKEEVVRPEQEKEARQGH